ncbi:hypothetical protein MRX96_032625 [Rhipicephalus microplus]
MPQKNLAADHHGRLVSGWSASFFFPPAASPQVDDNWTVSAAAEKAARLNRPRVGIRVGLLCVASCAALDLCRRREGGIEEEAYLALEFCRGNAVEGPLLVFDNGPLYLRERTPLPLER